MNMTDIIKVAKKCGMRFDAATEAYPSRITTYREQLQAFADHYRKEGAEEANKTIDALWRTIDLANEQITEQEQQLAATELVVEKMREALSKYTGQHDRHGSYCTAYEAVQLQPHLSALREHDNKLLEEVATWFSCEDTNTDYLRKDDVIKRISELRAKGDK